MRILISACLAGWRCRYDGNHYLDRKILTLLSTHELIPICPEVLGGLPIPREPAKIEGGDGRDVLKGQARIFLRSGKDVTENFLKGANKILNIAQQTEAQRAVLKEGSPSCGVKKFGDKKPGMGVTAALLKTHNIKVEGRL